VVEPTTAVMPVTRFLAARAPAATANPESTEPASVVDDAVKVDV